MKFKCSVVIQAPRKRVVELFENPDYLSKWQEGFVSMTPISGEPGMVGSTSEMVYLMQGQSKKILLTETVLVNQLPHEFTGQYESMMTKNTMRNVFTDLGNQTRYDAYVDYTELKGCMLKIFKVFMPNLFQKQTQKWMDNFKAFVEDQV